VKTAAAPEFSRFVKLDELDDGDVHRPIEAGEQERLALASRFDLIGIDALAADVRVRRVPGGVLVRVEGQLRADIVQRCVVTLEPAPAHVEEEFHETFGPDGYRPPDGDEDAELTGVFEEGGLDIGELVAQLLYLSLDPYPRAPGAEPMRDIAETETAEDRRKPFAGLGKMMQKRRK